MALFFASNSRVLTAQYDLACKTRSAAIDVEAAELDVTVMCSGGWVEMIAGLRKQQIMLDGFNDYAAGDIDQLLSTVPQVAPWSLCPQSADDAAIVYLTSALELKFNPVAAKIGDMVTFQAMVRGIVPLAKGLVMHPHLTGNTALVRTVSGTGTVQQLGPIPSGRRMWMNGHVLAAGGTGTPTLQWKLQSSTSGAFTVPTDRLTSAIYTTTPGSENQSLIGPITDQFWRVVWTFTGTTNAAQFAVTAGIA